MNLNPLASGNKTIAAAGVSSFLGLLIAVGMIWDLPTYFWWWDKAIQTVGLVGGFLAATGLSHKVLKFWKSRNAS